ncbi:MAG: metalloregulator ArsR/SmtB family transcription factor [Spirochaetes bacterium]|nr:metalloregulator ArsR/SmtB family transcription factor [Spirochaetota bacterium]MBU0954391.1 metalloregulator ArsR/SmtB family transcription factor [Spirochaetota bacterium]
MAPNNTCNEDQLSDFSRKLKAVGHPVRLKLLCLIAHEEDPCVSDLWQCLQQPQPVVSQHLSILKENGIVDSEVQKTRRVYSIKDPFIKQMIKDMLAVIENNKAGN